MDFKLFADGSVRGGIEHGGAGLVVVSQGDLVHEWHAVTGTHSSSFQAVKAVLRETIQWLSFNSSWASAIIICDCKSLVQAVINANSDDSSIIQMLAASTLLAMSKQILIVWAHGHCRLSGNELADHHAKHGAAETQPVNAIEAATQRAHIRFSCRQPPIQHERLKEVCTSPPDEQIEMSFANTELTDLSRFSMVITQLFDAGRIWWESPRMSSANCWARKSNLHSTLSTRSSSASEDHPQASAVTSTATTTSGRTRRPLLSSMSTRRSTVVKVIRTPGI